MMLRECVNLLAFSIDMWDESRKLLPKCCMTAENYRNGRKVDWKALEEYTSVQEQRVYQPETLGKS